MTVSKFLNLMALLLVIPITMLIGCSDKTFTSDKPIIASSANPVDYAPLEQGLRVSYTILEPETGYFDIEIGEPARVAGNSGYTFIQTNLNTGETTVFYRYRKDNSVYESFDINNPGSRILQSPFVPGHSWHRFDTDTDEPPDILDQDDGENDGNLDYETYTGGKGWINIFGGGFFKDKPDLDYNIMKIVGIEDVHTINGHIFGSCLKVAWQTDPLHTSYFWYYPGVGLVKFEHGFNTVYDETNHIVAVMTNYRVVEY